MTTEHATLVLVRPDPKSPRRNLPVDVAAAREAAAKPPCWVVLVGGARERRLNDIRQSLGTRGIAKDGVNVYGPVEVCSDEWSPSDEADLPNRLARYLADTGLRMVLERFPSVEVRVAADVPPALLAAVAEAVAVYANANLRVGEVLLESSLRWEIRRDRFRAPGPGKPFTELIGDSPVMRKLSAQIERYAPHPYPVLILGETGTGKELVAKMLHQESRRQGNFMPTNAAMLSPDLAESLLFGHQKGAFTGADRDRPGRIRESEGGTFFLDEVFNLHPAVQGKLLRALNRADKGVIEVEPLGSTQKHVVHSRLVVAAQQDPRAARAADGVSPMREDLFFRVAVCVVQLPPLRERLADLPQLCPHLLRLAGAEAGVSDDGLAVLREHRWPGNIRELRLVLLRAVVDGPPTADTLTADMLRHALRTAALPAGASSLPLPCDLATELKRIEVETMRAALRSTNENAAAAGRLVGMGEGSHNFKRKLDAAEARLRDASSAPGTGEP